MAILKKDVLAPILPEQRVVSVPELGGEVIVRPLTLSDVLALRQAGRDNRIKDFGHIAAVLAFSVVDAEGKALFTIEEWEAWGSQHIEAALLLFEEAWPISGLAQDAAAKNSTAQTSS